MNQREPTSTAVDVHATKTPIVLVLLFWLFVGLPLAWGIYNSVMQAMRLFR